MNGQTLQLREISVSFGPVQALTAVDLDVHQGEVLGLVGDNGAGKSTLIKVMAGLQRPDSGSVFVDGISARIESPHDAAAMGIAVVYQDLALCNDLDCVANLFLGREWHSRVGLLNEYSMELKAAEILRSLHVTTIRDLRVPVARLSGGQRQSVAVARAVIGEPSYVLLDEPTAALGVSQAAEVLTLIRQLREQGIGVVVISHNIVEVLAVSDRIHVLRLGRTNGVFINQELGSDQLVAAITGAYQASQALKEAAR